MDKSSKKNHHQVLTDEVACEVISKAFFNIIIKSEDADFIKKCYNIIQVDNRGHLKNKLKTNFTDVIKNNSPSEMISTGIIPQQNDSTDLFLRNLTNSSTNVLDELDGFDKWDH